jgi:hypothetical protein
MSVDVLMSVDGLQRDHAADQKHAQQQARGRVRRRGAPADEHGRRSGHRGHRWRWRRRRRRRKRAGQRRRRRPPTAAGIRMRHQPAQHAFSDDGLGAEVRIVIFSLHYPVLHRAAPRAAAHGELPRLVAHGIAQVHHSVRLVRQPMAAALVELAPRHLCAQADGMGLSVHIPRSTPHTAAPSGDG